MLRYNLSCKECGRTLEVSSETLKELRGTIDNDFVIVKAVTCSCGCLNVVQIDNTATEQMLVKTINNMRTIAKQVNNGQTKSKKKSKQIVRWNKQLNDKRKQLAEKYDGHIFVCEGMDFKVMFVPELLEQKEGESVD